AIIAETLTVICLHESTKTLLRQQAKTRVRAIAHKLTRDFAGIAIRFPKQVAGRGQVWLRSSFVAVVRMRSSRGCKTETCAAPDGVCCERSAGICQQISGRCGT